MLLLGLIGTHSVKVYVAVMWNCNVCFFPVVPNSGKVLQRPVQSI